MVTRAQMPALGNPNSVRLLNFLKAKDVHLLKHVAPGLPGYRGTGARVLENSRGCFNVDKRQNSHVGGC
jgi:hypothetical protein